MGMSTVRDKVPTTLKIFQHKYIMNILEKFIIKNDKSISTYSESYKILEEVIKKVGIRQESVGLGV